MQPDVSGENLKYIFFDLYTCTLTVIERFSKAFENRLTIELTLLNCGLFHKLNASMESISKKLSSFDITKQFPDF